MSLLSNKIFMFLNRKEHRAREQRLKDAKKRAWRETTMQLERNDVSIMMGNFITQEEIDEEFQKIAEDFRQIDAGGVRYAKRQKRKEKWDKVWNIFTFYILVPLTILILLFGFFAAIFMIIYGGNIQQ